MAVNWNDAIIEEFRANEGRVGGRFEGRTLLLLHTVGGKSGEARTNPLVYLADDGRFVVFGSKGGAPTHPDWYHNLLANPDVSIEVGTETIPVRAHVVGGAARDALWARQVAANPAFKDYEDKTDRTIPVIVLERRDA